MLDNPCAPIQGVLAAYIDMTGKKVDKAKELQVCLWVYLTDETYKIDVHLIVVDLS